MLGVFLVVGGWVLDVIFRVLDVIFQPNDDMTLPLRIAFLLGTFPVISETFILRQITGLLELGHDLRIFANTRPDDSAPIHAEVAKYNLLNRTTYVDGPPESIFWEL